MTEQLSESIDLNQLVIRVIPFETDDLTERYKEVKRVVDDFVYEVAPNYLGIGKQVLDIWQKDLFQNATQRNIELTISKKQLVWTIIVLTTDVEKNESEYLDEIDCCDYQEIVCLDLFFDFGNLFCRCGHNPYACNAHTVKKRIKLPPLRVLLWRRFQKELVYGYIVAEHKLKEYL